MTILQTLRQFIILIRPFWFNVRQWREWALLSLVIFCALAIVWVGVWIAEWNKTFYDALADFNGAVMPMLIARYLGYIALIVGLIVVGNALRKLLIMRWREHLTTQFEQLWLTHHRHYQLQLNNSPIDNPDQRISDDIFLLAEQSIDLFKYFIMNFAKIGAFVAVLWQLSGVQSFVFLGQTWTIHGYLVWVALLYSLICTVITHIIGRALQSLGVDRQHFEADYRASLLTLRENSEAIALYRGETAEQGRLYAKFAKIKANWHALIWRELKLETFSASYMRLSLFIPIFATLPMYLARTMTFGDVMQARSAFGNVQDGFGWFMDYYRKIMAWAVVVERLGEFLAILNTLENKKIIKNQSNNAILTTNLTVHTQAGKPLLTANFGVRQGDWLLIDGKSGIGKTTLFKTLAGLWQWYDGHFDINSDKVLFIPQKPYLPECSLRALVCYPATTADDETIKQNLIKVGLGELLVRYQLDDNQSWYGVLSGGQGQRIAMARVLCACPDLLFLDEATNQLDDDSSLALLHLLKQTLPTMAVVAISHQRAVKGLFGQRIEF